MKYEYAYKIKYQEVDDRRQLRLYNLENYLLEVAGTVADDLGFGIRQLYPMGLTWILTRLSVEMWELPTHSDKVVFETWIESDAHMLSTRNFRIYKVETQESKDERRLIGRCKSVWAVLDLEKREIANVFDHPMFDGAVDGEVLEMERAPRLRPIAVPTGSEQRRIEYSDLDYNCHCNSCKYLEKMIDTYRPKMSDEGVRLDIFYQHEAYEGERVEISYAIEEDGVTYQMHDGQGKTYCMAKVTTNSSPR